MIEIERTLNGKPTGSLSLAENWDEVYFSTYVKVMKDKILELENDYERSVKVVSAVSSDPEACEQWLREMSTADFNKIIKAMNFVGIDELPKSDKKYITLGKKKYKIRTQSEIPDTEWLPQTTFERLKEEYKGTEDYDLAFGVLLRECDSKGKEKPFDVKTFDYIVNNLTDKIKMVDIFQHIDFFLRGVKKSSLANSPSFTIKKIKLTPKE